MRIRRLPRTFLLPLPWSSKVATGSYDLHLPMDTAAAPLRLYGWAVWLRRWFGTGALLLLLLLAAHAMWRETHRIRILEVPAAEMAPSSPVGYVAVLTHVPVGQIRPGDVIEYRHPARREVSLFLRVGQIERVPASSGYLVRLESADPDREPWHAELHGAAWRVVTSFPPSSAVAPLIRAVGSPAAGAVAAAVSCSALVIAAIRWRAVRARGVARSYRTDLW
jgi:hypothetical protein